MKKPRYFGGRTARYGGKVHLAERLEGGGHILICDCPNTANGTAAARLHERFSVEHVNCASGRRMVERLRANGHLEDTC